MWVSNGGGRQIDRTRATIDVLEEVVDAVARRVEVPLDGGVRNVTALLGTPALAEISRSHVTQARTGTGTARRPHHNARP